MRTLSAGVASVPFVARLSSYGDRTALVTSTATVSYADLAARVDALAARLATARRLVLVAGGNDTEPLVGYLAALAAGCPAILVPGDNEAALAAVADAYDPDVVIRGAAVEERRAVSAHQLHPSLALLLSTSGSTGSPKLVRLSAENLQANAESIASYLAIRPSDVAATTLPLHYCYGLSVVNSHLLAGASLLLTSHSVVDPCFWDHFRRAGATTFAGVPHTFDLLDRVGFADMRLPTLRYLTQAGGRMAPSQVERYARLGQRNGFDLFVMYGQTEATARMAYLPPDRAASCPSAIGVPIPGGAFSLEPLPDPPTDAAAPQTGDEVAGAGEVDAEEVGELVYHGDNVMLGYAESPADLALGRAVTALRTGDVARQRTDGMYEIVGRRSRFAKVFGVRVDLDRVEQLLAAAGIHACCAEGGDRLVVAVESDHRGEVERLAGEHLGLPPSALRVRVIPTMPRLATGKPDYPAIAALAAGPDGSGTDRRTPVCDCDRPGCGCTGVQGWPAGAAVGDLVRLYGDVLGRSGVTEDDSFVGLGGDSLSYVETSIRLEELLGRLPADWHVRPIRSLTASRRGTGTRLRTLETNVLLRALAIVLIVGTHANLFAIVGGAHVLLGVAGFNFGRFRLTSTRRTERVRHLAGSVTRIVVPSVLWIGFAALLLTPYPWESVALLNSLAGSRDWSEPAWHFWFIEALVYILLALTALLALPAVDRLERRWPFWFPVVLLGLGLLTRYEVLVLRGGDVIHRAHIVFWLFALGWAAVKATSRWHRVLLSVAAVATVPGFFDDAQREALVVLGMLLLVWVPRLRVPPVVATAAGVLASASLYIYLSHWQIYPHLEDSHPFLAVLLSLAGGIVFWRVAGRVQALVSGARGGPDPGAGRSSRASV